jgi:hypothetical protein
VTMADKHDLYKLYKRFDRDRPSHQATLRRYLIKATRFSYASSACARSSGCLRLSTLRVCEEGPGKSHSE